MFDPSIYKHRSKYTTPTISPESNIQHHFDSDLLDAFWWYAKKRMEIWHQKNAGLAWPRTDDSILQTYKFCNAYRELDKQTIYIHKKLAHLRDNFPLWLCNLMMFRFIAKIETFESLWIYDYRMSSPPSREAGAEIQTRFPPIDPRRNRQSGDDIQREWHTEISKKYEDKLRSLLSPKFGDAYLFPPQVPQTLGYHDRYDFICQYLPKISWELAGLLETFDDLSVSDALSLVLQKLNIWLKFHFTEILIDVAYQYPELINLNGKFWIWPGSRPTMKRFDAKKTPEEVCLLLIQTQPQNFPYLEIDGKQMPITAEWIEWLWCEFRKYSNLKLWGGKKRVYRG